MPKTYRNRRKRTEYTKSVNVTVLSKNTAQEKELAEPKTITVTEGLINKVKLAVKAGLSYEKATDGHRKLGITGEVGEIIACKQLGLKLVLSARSEGFDAIDEHGLHVEIKSRRSESEGLPAMLEGRVASLNTSSIMHFSFCLIRVIDYARFGVLIIRS